MPGTPTANLPSAATPPPIFNGPFVDKSGVPTAAAVDMLTKLWALAYSAFTASIDTVAAAPLTPLLPSYAPGQWKPTIAGDTAAGAATYTTQQGLSLSFGPMTLAAFNIALSGAPAGATGNAIVGGFTPPPSPAWALQAGWIGSWGGITLAANFTQLGVVATAAGKLALYESGSAQAATALPVTAIGAAASVVGAVFYFR